MSAAEPPARFLAALDALPRGTSTGHYKGRRYAISISTFNNARSLKLVAEETGGRDYISLNLYHLTAGARLYPCEMSRTKVIAFVTGVTPDP